MVETGSSSAGDGKYDWAQVDDDTWAALALRLRGIGNAIDARYRHQRLVYAPMGPWQVTLAAVAAAIPPAAGGLLNWALFERSVAARAVAIYFIVAGLEAAVVWFAIPFLSIGRYAERRAERLRVRLHTTLCRGVPDTAVEKGDSDERGRVGRILDLSSAPQTAELVLTASRGFSVFALWPDAEPHLLERDWRELSALVTRFRTLQGIAVTSVIAAIASVVVALTGPQPRPQLVVPIVLGAALIIVAAGAFTRINGAAREILDRKSQLIARHGAAILAAYSMGASAPGKRLRKLGELSARILEGASGLPRSPRAGDAAGHSLPGVEEAVEQSVEASIRQVLHREPVTNVTGVLDLWLTRPDEDRGQLEVTVTTGPDAWQRTPRRGGRRFELTGGEDRATAPFEIAVDAPGLNVKPSRRATEVPTVGGTVRWIFSLQGTWGDDVIIWVTLYSSGRYLQAVQLPEQSRRSGL